MRSIDPSFFYRWFTLQKIIAFDTFIHVNKVLVTGKPACSSPGAKTNGMRCPRCEGGQGCQARKGYAVPEQKEPLKRCGPLVAGRGGWDGAGARGHGGGGRRGAAPPAGGTAPRPGHKVAAVAG